MTVIASDITQSNIENNQKYANEIQYVNIDGTLYYIYNGKYFRKLESYQVQKSGNSYSVDGRVVGQYSFTSYFGSNYFLSEDNLTCYVFKEETTSIPTDKLAEIGNTIPVLSAVMGKYFTMHTQLTISLRAEYRTEGFVGFMVSYDGTTEHDLYKVEDVGYSFTFTVMANAFIYAVFEDSAGLAQNNPDNNNLGSGNGDYSASVEKTMIFEAEEGKYITGIRMPSMFEMVYSFNQKKDDFAAPINRFSINIVVNNVTLSIDDSASSFTEDDFGQIFYTKIALKVNYDESNAAHSDLGTHAKYVITQKNISILHINITENDGPVTGNNTISKLNMFYPAEELNEKIPASFGMINGRYYVTNDRILNYLRTIGIMKKDATGKTVIIEDGHNPRIKDGYFFSDTLLVRSNVEAFGDGFWSSTIVTFNGVSANSVYIDGVFDGDGNWNKENIAYVEPSSMEDTAQNILTYNYKTNGTIRIFVHPEYYNTSNGEYSAEMTESMMNKEYDEEEFISNAFGSISRGVYINEPAYDATIPRTLDIAGGAEGVWYYDIEYQFSKPLALEFTAPYLAFDYYCFKNSTGTYVRFSDYETVEGPGITLKTNNSALSISYGEFSQLMFDCGRDDGMVELHCFARENIKKTTMEFDYQNAKIGLEVQIGFASTITYIIDDIDKTVYWRRPTYGQDNDIRSYTLVSTSDENDKITISASSYVNNSTGKYYIDFIYGQNLIAQQARFNITLLDYQPVKQSSAGDASNLFLYSNDSLTYSLNCYDAYCDNRTQIVNFETQVDKAVVSWQLGGSFANDNIVKIATNKYYKIIYSTNGGFDSTGTRFTLKEGTNPANTGLKFGTNVNSRYTYTYVLDGQPVKISYVIQDENNKPSIFYKTNVTNTQMRDHSSTYPTLAHKYYIWNFLTSTANVKSTDALKLKPTSTWLGSNSRMTDLSTKSLYVTNGEREEEISYTYHPKSNDAFLANFNGGGEASNRFLFAIIAADNSSRFEIDNGEGNLINTGADEGSKFNVVSKIVSNDDGVYVVQHCVDDDNTKYYATYEIMEKNGYLFTDAESEFYPNERYSITNFNIKNNFNLYVFASKVLDGATGAKDYPRQYLFQAKTKERQTVVDILNKRQTMVSVVTLGDVDYVYKTDEVKFTEEGTGTLDEFGNVTNLSSGVADTNLKITKDRTVHAISFVFNAKLYYFVDGKIYLESAYLDADGKVKDADEVTDDDKFVEYNDLKVEYDPRSEGYYFAVDYSNYSITVYNLIYKSGNYTLSNGVLKNSVGAPIEVTTSYFDSENGPVCMLKSGGQVLDGFKLTKIEKLETFYLKDSLEREERIKEIKENIGLLRGANRTADAEKLEQHLLKVERCYLLKTIKRKINMNNNATAIVAQDPSDSTYYLNPDFEEDEVNAKQNIAVKYEQLAAETNDVKVYTYLSESKDYYLVDGSLYSNYFDSTTKIGAVYYLTVSDIANGKPGTYRFSKADGTLIYGSTTVTADEVNTLKVSYEPKTGSVTRTLYYKDGKLYTTASRTTAYSGAYKLNSPYLAYVTSPTVTFSTNNLGSTTTFKQSTYAIENYNSVTIDGTMFMVGDDFKLYKSFPFTTDNLITCDGLSVGRFFTANDYKYKKLRTYAVYPAYIAFEDNRYEFYRYYEDTSTGNYTKILYRFFDTTEHFIVFRIPDSSNLTTSKYQVNKSNDNGAILADITTDDELVFPEKFRVLCKYYKTSEQGGDNIICTYYSVKYNKKLYTIDIGTLIQGEDKKSVQYKASGGAVIYANLTDPEIKFCTDADLNDEIDDNLLIFNDLRYYVRKLDTAFDSTNLIFYNTSSNQDSVYQLEDTNSYQTFSNDKMELASSKATIKSIRVDMFTGYYLKGFLLVSDFSAASSTWLHYVLTSSGGKVFNGLQGTEYFSGYTLGTFISVDYSAITDEPECPIKITKSGGDFYRIAYDIEIPINSCMQIFAVYAPVVYTIEVTKIDISTLDNVDDVTISVDDYQEDNENKKGLNSQLFASDAEPQDSVSAGNVKGTMIVEHKGFSMLAVTATNGNNYLGYSLAKKESGKMTSLKTANTTSEVIDETSEMYILAKEKIGGSNNEKSDSPENNLFYNKLDVVENKGSNLILHPSYKFFMNQQSTSSASLSSPDDSKIRIYGESRSKQKVQFTEANNIVKNTLFFSGFTDNVGLYVYFNAMSYNLTIELAETQQGIYDPENGKQETQDSYIEYTNLTGNNPAYSAKSKYYTSNATYMGNDYFKYPSDEEKIAKEGTVELSSCYNFETTIQTKGGNKTYEYKKPDSNDPLVYTLFDNYGTLISQVSEVGGSASDKYYATPTPILNSMIDYTASANAGFLVYRRNADGKYYVPSIVRKAASGTKKSMSIVTADKETIKINYFEDADGLWVYQTFYYYEIKGTDGYTLGDTNSKYNLTTTQKVKATRKSEDGYAYLAIPYRQEAGENYLEYNSSFMDESVNKSLANVSKDYFKDKQVAVYYGTDKVVNANDKFVYGIDLKNIGSSVDNNDGASSLNKIFVKRIQSDEVDYDGSTGIMIYKEKISNTTYIVPASLLQKKLEGSDKLMFETDLTKYTYSAALTALKSTDLAVKEAYENIVIYKTNVDIIAAEHKCYNITSTNITRGSSASALGMKGVDPNEMFSAVTETSMFLLSDGTNASTGGVYYKLMKDLFVITINSCYVINSEAFTTKSNKIYATIDGAGDEDAKSFTSGLYIKTNSTGTSIVATMKIYYENGSVPDIVIKQKSPKLKQDEKSSTNNPDTLNVVGVETNYEYNNMKNALVYKPSGTAESLGTKSDGNITNSADAHYLARGKDVQGYFSNVFSAGYEMQDCGFFSLPNLNVKLTLVYAFKLKSIKASVTLVNRVESGSSYSEGTPKAASMFSSTGTSQSSTDGIYADGKIGNVFMRVMSGNKNKMDNRSADEHTKNRMVKTYSTYYGFAYNNYNIYVINDAYNVMDMLQFMLITQSNVSTSNRLKIAKLYSYISTFNPNDYDSGAEMQYLFDDAYSNKGDPLSGYRYRDLYNFLVEQLTITGNSTDAKETCNNFISMLPLPSSTNKYMKINRIDVASAARSAIQINFIANQFKQTDLVLSVIELKEQYQEQKFVKGRVGAIDAIADFGSSLWNWVTGKGFKSTIEERQDAYGVRAYSYYPAAKGGFTAEGNSPMFSFSDGHIANALSFNASEETPMQVYKGLTDDIDSPIFASLVASIYQMSSNRKGNYFATTTSSATLTNVEFYNNSNNKTTAVKSNVSLYTGEDTRLPTKFYELDPEDYKTKHDRVTMIVAIIAEVVGIIGCIVAMCTPVGWIATAATIVAGVAVAVAYAALIERVSSEVTLALNEEAMKDILMQSRAAVYSRSYVLKDGLITFNRVPDKDIDEEVKKAIAAG